MTGVCYLCPCPELLGRKWLIKQVNGALRVRRPPRLRVTAAKRRQDSKEVLAVPSKSSLLRRTKADLERELEARGLATAGRKEELAGRLLAFLAAEGVQGQAEGIASESQGIDKGASNGDEGEGGVLAPVEALKTFTKVQLQSRLAALNLPKTGRKEELIARLAAGLAARATTAAPTTPTTTAPVREGATVDEKKGVPVDAEAEGAQQPQQHVEQQEEQQGQGQQPGGAAAAGPVEGRQPSERDRRGAFKSRRGGRAPPVAAEVARRHQQDEIPSYPPLSLDEEEFKAALGPYAAMPERAPEADLLPCGLLEEEGTPESEILPQPPPGEPSMSAQPPPQQQPQQPPSEGAKQQEAVVELTQPAEQCTGGAAAVAAAAARQQEQDREAAASAPGGTAGQPQQPQQGQQSQQREKSSLAAATASRGSGREGEVEGLPKEVVALAAATALGEVSLGAAQLPTPLTESLDEQLAQVAEDVLAEAAAAAVFAPPSHEGKSAEVAGEAAGAADSSSQLAGAVEAAVSPTMQAISPAVAAEDAQEVGEEKKEREGEGLRPARQELRKEVVALAAATALGEVSLGAAQLPTPLTESLDEQLAQAAEDVLAEAAAAAVFAPPSQEAGSWELGGEAPGVDAGDKAGVEATAAAAVAAHGTEADGGGAAVPVEGPGESIEAEQAEAKAGAVSAFSRAQAPSTKQGARAAGAAPAAANANDAGASLGAPVPGFQGKDNDADLAQPAGAAAAAAGPAAAGGDFSALVESEGEGKEAAAFASAVGMLRGNLVAGFSVTQEPLPPGLGAPDTPVPESVAAGAMQEPASQVKRSQPAARTFGAERRGWQAAAGQGGDSKAQGAGGLLSVAAEAFKLISSLLGGAGDKGKKQ